MCGLVGVLGDVNADAIKAFNDLLVIDQIRGPHSTGVLGVSADGRYDLFKQAFTPTELMQWKAYDRVVHQGRRVLMGHNRFATVGGINKWNAHPFDTNDVVGAHNGTIRNLHVLKHRALYDTDSEALLDEIGEDGIENVLPKVEGAWALTFFDKDTNKLCFIRNKERPLYYAFSENRRQMFWASEAIMLRFVFVRHGIKTGEITQFPEDQLHVFTMPKLVVDAIAEPDIREIKGREVPPATPFPSGSVGEVKTQAEYEEWKKKWKEGKAEREAKKQKGTNLTLVSGPAWWDKGGADSSFHIPRDYDGNVISYGLWQKNFSECKCGWCSADIDYGDKFKPITRNNDFLCDVCLSDETIADFFLEVA